MSQLHSKLSPRFPSCFFFTAALELWYCIAFCKCVPERITLQISSPSKFAYTCSGSYLLSSPFPKQSTVHWHLNPKKRNCNDNQISTKSYNHQFFQSGFGHVPSMKKHSINFFFFITKLKTLSLYLVLLKTFFSFVATSVSLFCWKIWTDISVRSLN